MRYTYVACSVIPEHFVLQPQVVDLDQLVLDVFALFPCFSVPPSFDVHRAILRYLPNVGSLIQHAVARQPVPFLDVSG